MQVRLAPSVAETIRRVRAAHPLDPRCLCEACARERDARQQDQQAQRREQLRAGQRAAEAAARRTYVPPRPRHVPGAGDAPVFPSHDRRLYAVVNDGGTVRRLGVSHHTKAQKKAAKRQRQQERAAR